MVEPFVALRHLLFGVTDFSGEEAFPCIRQCRDVFVHEIQEMRYG